MTRESSPLDRMRALKPRKRRNGVEPALIVEAILAIRRGCPREEVAAIMGLKNTSHANIYAHVGSWAIKHAKLD